MHWCVLRTQLLYLSKHRRFIVRPRNGTERSERTERRKEKNRLLSQVLPIRACLCVGRVSCLLFPRPVPDTVSLARSSVCMPQTHPDPQQCQPQASWGGPDKESHAHRNEKKGEKKTSQILEKTGTSRSHCFVAFAQLLYGIVARCYRSGSAFVCVSDCHQCPQNQLDQWSDQVHPFASRRTALFVVPSVRWCACVCVCVCFRSVNCLQSHILHLVPRAVVPKGNQVGISREGSVTVSSGCVCA